jgi:hypothetical protein
MPRSFWASPVPLRRSGNPAFAEAGMRYRKPVIDTVTHSG